MLVPSRGNAVANQREGKNKNSSGAMSRGVIRVDKSGNKFIQFPNGSVSQIVCVSHMLVSSQLLIALSCRKQGR